MVIAKSWECTLVRMDLTLCDLPWVCLFVFGGRLHPIHCMHFFQRNAYKVSVQPLQSMKRLVEIERLHLSSRCVVEFFA